MAIPFSFVDSSATIGATEYSLPAASTTLTAQTTDAYVQVFIDFAAMTSTEQYRIQIYESINGGSQLVVYAADIVGVQPGPFVTPLMMLGNGWNVTVKKIAGTDRSIGWSIRKDTGDRALGAGAITSSSFAADAIDANALAASATSEIATAVAAPSASTIAAAVAAPSAATIAAAVWESISEGTETVVQALRLIRSRLIGKATVQDGDGTYSFRDAGDTKNRVVLARSGTARTVTSTDGT